VPKEIATDRVVGPLNVLDDAEEAGDRYTEGKREYCSPTRNESMNTVTIEEAQQKLAELIDHLAAGERVIITRDAHPVARLEREPSCVPVRRQPGSAKGRLVVLAEDDEHMRDFEGYTG
jgi:antitoxin (DNA-binding transcriptional repressor) of toxin-antitoxin stability system